mgnify:CR=1 FL=1
MLELWAGDTTGALSFASVTVTATPEAGDPTTFEADIRIDTPKERDYFENGGILHYVLRQLAA